MKKFYFLALAALVLSLAACGPKVIEKKFEKTNFATVTVEGSGKYGVKDVVSGREILPQSFDNIGYYYSGFFTAKDNTGVQLFDEAGKCVIPAQEQISAKEGYFEFTKGDTKGFYFIKEKSTVSGVYNKFEIDAAGNISFVKDGKYGVLNKKGEIVIPGEYELILWDGKNYNAAKKQKTTSGRILMPEPNVSTGTWLKPPFLTLTASW